MHGYVCTCAWSENIRGTTSISSAGAFGLANHESIICDRYNVPWLPRRGCRKILSADGEDGCTRRFQAKHGIQHCCGC